MFPRRTDESSRLEIATPAVRTVKIIVVHRLHADDRRLPFTPIVQDENHPIFSVSWHSRSLQTGQFIASQQRFVQLLK